MSSTYTITLERIDHGVLPSTISAGHAVPLGAGDFAQLKQPKGHMLGDTEKEIRFAYVGLPAPADYGKFFDYSMVRRSTAS